MKGETPVGSGGLTQNDHEASDRSTFSDLSVDGSPAKPGDNFWWDTETQQWVEDEPLDPNNPDDADFLSHVFVPPGDLSDVDQFEREPTLADLVILKIVKDQPERPAWFPARETLAWVIVCDADNPKIKWGLKATWQAYQVVKAATAQANPHEVMAWLNDHEYEPASDSDFWAARPVLRRLHTFARSRRVGPWAMLGCVLAQTVAAVTPKIVLPPLVGSHASLNLFVGIVSETGGGKGSAEDAALNAIDLPPTLTIGPGSGEGLGHLFVHRTKDKETGKFELDQHCTAVILSAAEVETMAALKGRQASTLFPELRKAWKGESLGFAYADPTKRLTAAPHSYRLCMIVGVQPSIATPILEDADAGMPQRFLWLPADDQDAPDIAPDEPVALQWSPRWAAHDSINDPKALRPMSVPDMARIEIDQARLRRLRGETNGDLDSHALLAQLKIAAALALLDERTEMINEGDWYLASIIRKISDQTREQMINKLNQAKAQTNRARGQAEAEREVIKLDAVERKAVQRVSRSLLAKLEKINDWVPHNKLRTTLASRDRDHFEDAITALIDAGQAEERAIEDQHAGHQGTEYRIRR